MLKYHNLIVLIEVNYSHYDESETSKKYKKVNKLFEFKNGYFLEWCSVQCICG